MMTQLRVKRASGIPARFLRSAVHYDMTEWIAKGVLFDRREAREIAVATDRVDRVHDSGPLGWFAALARSAVTGGRAWSEYKAMIKRYHFPRIPAHDHGACIPVGRLTAGFEIAWTAGHGARRMLDQALARGRRHGGPGVEFNELGEALHAIQDSFAHQGFDTSHGMASILSLAGLAVNPDKLCTENAQRLRATAAATLAALREAYEADDRPEGACRWREHRTYVCWAVDTWFRDVLDGAPAKRYRWPEPRPARTRSPVRVS